MDFDIEKYNKLSESNKTRFKILIISLIRGIDFEKVKNALDKVSEIEERELRRSKM
jgi:hypothetical protein